MHAVLKQWPFLVLPENALTGQSSRDEDITWKCARFRVHSGCMRQNCYLDAEKFDKSLRFCLNVFRALKNSKTYQFLRRLGALEMHAQKSYLTSARHVLPQDKDEKGAWVTTNSNISHASKII